MTYRQYRVWNRAIPGIADQVFYSIMYLGEVIAAAWYGETDQLRHEREDTRWDLENP